ncbi:MAG TPA: TPM domain-containing protein [Gemmatimonadales bacterium]|nr:TPM domain-containing protein [Gemmatimonadales bacterium]
MSTTRRKGTALLAGLQLTLAAAAGPMVAPGATVAAATLMASPAAAQSAVDQLVPARPQGYVSDFAGLLAPGSRDGLEDLLTRLRAATGAEMAVVTLPSIGDQDEAAVALAIGRKWGVGAKADIGDSTRNAGLVLLVVPRQNHQPGTGRVRIEVGRGLEGIVPDVAAYRIRNDLMGPLLAAEQYDSAIVAGTRTLTSVIARGFGVTDSSLASTPLPAAPSGGPSGSFVGLLPILLFVLFIYLASRSGGRRRRVYWGGGPWIGGGGFGGGGGGFGGGGFGGFGGGGGFSGGGSGGRF